MKKFYLILLLNLSIAASAQNDYLKFPSYETVVHQFYDNYSSKKMSENTELRFEKRPTGWHITLNDATKDIGILKDELFWDLKKNKFNNINFEPIESPDINATIIDNLLRQYDQKYYSICPYYGYPGWDRDIIENFKDATHLPDSTLYAVGRAYSSYASNLIHNNSGMAQSEFQFKLAPGKNSMNKEQLERYRFNRHKAIEKFELVKKMNPSYQTLVGNIGVKTANEYMVGFLDLRVFQNEEEAKKELRPGLYSTFEMTAAKNYLIACAPNAILFCSGDNDTYPLLYLQAQYNFRPDVLIVNLSLLNTDRYINSLRDSVLNSKGLPISFTAQEISADQRSLLLIENKDSTVMELSEIIQFVKDVRNQKPFSNSTYYYFPSSQFKLTHGKKEIVWHATKTYTYLNELIVYDVMATNDWERPLNFAITMGTDYFFGLEDYFRSDGMVYILTDTKKDTIDDYNGYVNSAMLYEKLMKQFEWKGIDSVTKGDEMVCSNYRNLFLRLALSLTKENKNELAIKALDRSVERMPDHKVPFDYYFIMYVEAYYKLGAFAKGNAIARQIYKNLTAELRNQNNSNSSTQNNADYGIQYLINLAQLNNQRELMDEMKK